MTSSDSRRFWRASLFLPLLGAVAGMFLDGFRVLYAGGALVAIPYIPFAILSWWFLGRCQTVSEHVVASFLWPVLFAPAGIILGIAAALFFGHAWTHIPQLLAGEAIIVLVYGYAYQLFALLLFACFRLLLPLLRRTVSR
jgi:hypothetical protein